MKKNTITFLIWVICTSILATPNVDISRFTISGIVKDKQSGEPLPGAAILVENTSWGTATNLDGKFELRLPAADYVFIVSFMGYNNLKKKVQISKDEKINFLLEPSELVLREVEISGIKPDANVTSTQMSMQKLDIKKIERLPSFLGEVDIIKSIQLLPGVTSASEGSSGFSVRGGATDQNLILLDRAPIYNASHIIGFFSVFNQDAIQNATLYKGDIPAYAGGRLSSFLEVEPKYGSTERIKVKGGVGTISSRLTVEGPINERSTFLLSGRRTYADILLKFSSDPGLSDTKLNFYDLNFAYRYSINAKNRIFITAYNGRDNFKTSFSSLGFGNTLGNVHWSNVINSKLQSDVFVYATRYKYDLAGGPIPDQQIYAESLIDDVGANWTMKYNWKPDVEMTWGASSVKHIIRPGFFRPEGDNNTFDEFKVPNSNSIESALFGGINPKIGDRLTLKIAGRLNMFNNIGPGTIYNYDEDFNSVDSVSYSKGIFNTYVRFEPRVGFTYLVNSKTSIKGSYNLNYQFMSLAKNSVAGNGFEVWFSSSPNIKPQSMNQFTLGFFKNLDDNKIELSVEGFYKDYNNTIDFKDFAQLSFNPELEGEVRVGESWAYGVEFLAKFTYDNWFGWLGYTYSRSRYKIPDINSGFTYISPFDKPHEISAVINYQVNQRLSVSASWVYATGIPYTAPVGRYEFENTVIPIYSKRNELRYPDYHRLDLALTYQLNKKSSNRYRHSLNLSIYNVYNRHNAWAINYIPTTDDPYVLEGEKTYLFPFLPALTYNFNF